MYELVSIFVLCTALWFWGPSSAALLAYLPAINLTEWRPVSPLTLWYNRVPTSVSTAETPVVQTPATPASQVPVRCTDTAAITVFLNESFWFVHEGCILTHDYLSIFSLSPFCPLWLSRVPTWSDWNVWSASWLCCGSSFSREIINRTSVMATFWGSTTPWRSSCTLRQTGRVWAYGCPHCWTRGLVSCTESWSRNRHEEFR